MKKRFLFVLAGMIFIISVSGQHSDTTYERQPAKLGWLITHDDSSWNYWIKPIWMVETDISITKTGKCPSTMYWIGDNKDSMGMYSSKSPLDTAKCKGGPCGCLESSTLWLWQKYQGDSIVEENDCTTGSYGTYKTEYFKPTKNPKKYKYGEKYELSKNDHYAETRSWNPSNIAWGCQ